MMSSRWFWSSFPFFSTKDMGLENVLYGPLWMQLCHGYPLLITLDEKHRSSQWKRKQWFHAFQSKCHPYVDDCPSLLPIFYTHPHFTILLRVTIMEMHLSSQSHPFPTASQFQQWHIVWQDQESLQLLFNRLSTLPDLFSMCETWSSLYLTVYCVMISVTGAAGEATAGREVADIFNRVSVL